MPSVRDRWFKICPAVETETEGAVWPSLLHTAFGMSFHSWILFPFIFFLCDSHILQLVWFRNVPTVMTGAGVTATSHNSCLLDYIPFPDVHPAVSLPGIKRERDNFRTVQNHETVIVWSVIHYEYLRKLVESVWQSGSRDLKFHSYSGLSYSLCKRFISFNQFASFNFVLILLHNVTVIKTVWTAVLAFLKRQKKCEH